MTVPAKNTWTIMLYLSGDNNLSPEMVRAINDIEHTGVPPGCTITIQYDALSPCVPTCRYVLPPREATEPIPPGIPFQYGFVQTVKDEKGEDVEDAGDPNTLKDFVEWSVREFPSIHRMLILSGHGSGAVGDFLTDENVRKSRQPGSLTIPGLTQALKGCAWSNGPLIQVLGMDSCLMSTLEVAHQLRGTIEYLVASEGFVPNSGWPYAHLLGRLKEHVEVNLPAVMGPEAPRLLSEFMVEDCAEFYEEYLAAGLSFDIAACEVKATAVLKDAVQYLVKECGDLSDERLQNSLILSHWRAQSFKFEQYTDLWDFAAQLQKYEPRLAQQCQAVMDAVDAAVTRQRYVGVEFQHAHGLSIYFPWSTPAYYDDDYLTQYGKLEFAESSGWFGLLTNYLDRTRREVRDPRNDLAHEDFPQELGKKTFRRPLVTSRNKFAAEYSKFAAEYSKYLIERLGGRIPWSMKNPPQQVKILGLAQRKTAKALAREAISASSGGDTSV